VGEEHRRVVVDVGRLHHHANLAPGLERVDPLDALLLGRDLLQRL
jgi:hypothetical protein